MKYMLTAGDDPDTSGVITGPMGGALVYDSMESACEAAKHIVRHRKAGHPDLPADWGVFVHKLATVAFYMPTTAGHVDETVVHPEKEDPRGGAN